MNAKTAKLLRRYCKKYNKNYKLSKLQFSKMSARKQFDMIVNLKIVLKETHVVFDSQSPSRTLFKGVAPSPLLSPTEKSTKSTPVRGVTHDGGGD